VELREWKSIGTHSGCADRFHRAPHVFCRNPADALNLSGSSPDISRGRDFDPFEFGVPDMPKAARISVKIPASTVSSEKSESHPLVSIAIFSGIGLLISLIAILMGVQGAWY
jgi:hypothetical protein